MWLAKDVSYNECCPLTTGSIGCTNTLLTLQQAVTSALVTETSSRGWGYSWIKATDLIRSVQGSIVSEMLQDQGILKSPRGCKTLASSTALTPPTAGPWATTHGCPHCQQRWPWDGDLLHSDGNTQTSLSHASAYPHVFSHIDLYWTPTAHSQAVFLRKASLP